MLHNRIRNNELLGFVKVFGCEPGQMMNSDKEIPQWKLDTMCKALRWLLSYDRFALKDMGAFFST